MRLLSEIGSVEITPKLLRILAISQYRTGVQFVEALYEVSEE